MKDRSLFNILVYPKFQIPAMCLIVVTALAMLVILGSFIILESKMLLALAEKTGQTELVINQLWKFGFIIGTVAVLATALLSVWALFLTHRLVGPLPRIKDEIDQMRENKQLQLFHVRDHDYLRPFFTKLNKVLADVIESQEWDMQDH